MSKFLDLLNGKIPEYSGAIIVPVEDVITFSNYDANEKAAYFTAPRLLDDSEVIEYATTRTGMKRLYVCMGYPFWNGNAYEWKVRE